MRHLREALVILLAVALSTAAGYGLALAASDLTGGAGGWGGIAAIGFAGGATLLALVSAALANLVLQRRSWRLAYVVVTLVVSVSLLLRASRSGIAGALPAALAVTLAVVVAGWLPVGARWWLDRSAAPPLGRRSALVAGAVVAFVVLAAASAVVAVLGSAVPAGIVGPALLLVVSAAFASGRVADTFALGLLLGVVACVVIFQLGSLADGRLATGALGLAVLITFAWHPAAVRLDRARGAARLGVPAVPSDSPEAARDDGEGTAPDAATPA